MHLLHLSRWTNNSSAKWLHKLRRVSTVAAISSSGKSLSGPEAGKRENCFARAIEWEYTTLHISSANMFRVLTIFDMTFTELRLALSMESSARDPATVDCNTLLWLLAERSGWWRVRGKYDNKINFFITRTCFSFDRNYFCFYFRSQRIVSRIALLFFAALSSIFFLLLANNTAQHNIIFLHLHSSSTQHANLSCVLNQENQVESWSSGVGKLKANSEKWKCQ